MKKFAIAAALGALTVSMPAFAADVSGTVTVNGNVASKCLFTTGAATITIDELAGADGKLDAATVADKTATLAGWCNKSASKISVDATSLSNTTAAPAPGFTRSVNYTATATAYGADSVSVGSATDSNSTDATAGTAASIPMFHGDIKVVLSSASTTTATDLLAAGAYQGSVKVTLTPGV